MKNQLKSLIPLIDKLTKENLILRLFIYSVLIVSFVLIFTSIIISLIK